jgi:hypothetical protein
VPGARCCEPCVCDGVKSHSLQTSTGDIPSCSIFLLTTSISIISHMTFLTCPYLLLDSRKRKRLCSTFSEFALQPVPSDPSVAYCYRPGLRPYFASNLLSFNLLFLVLHSLRYRYMYILASRFVRFLPCSFMDTKTSTPPASPPPSPPQPEPLPPEIAVSLLAW